jgi:hypothetical protein
MALITDMPEDVASSNDLDNVVDPDADEDGERAEVYLSGAHVCTLDHAPSGLGRITLMVELEVVEESIRFTEDGEVPIRRCRRVGDMWIPGTQRPPTREEIRAAQLAAKAKAAAEQAEKDEAERAEKEQNEPPMFEEDGNPLSDDAPRLTVVEDQDQDQDDDGDPNPAFSDGKSS